jgi:hypothetical protein
MKTCTHTLQGVLNNGDNTRTQVCIPCGIIVAKWDIRSDTMLYELPPSKTVISGTEDQALS